MEKYTATSSPSASKALRCAAIAAGLASAVFLLCLTQALAASPAPAQTAGSADSPSAAAVVPDPPEENGPCIVCHVNEAESAADAKCPASLHAFLTCATCHDDGDVLDDLHAKTKAKRMPLRLKKTTVEDETCASCHMKGAEETDDAKKAAAEDFLALSEGSLLADVNGLEVNPHAMVGLETHDGIQCISCHEMHGDSKPAERSAKLCASCHHANVFECFTCHEHS